MSCILLAATTLIVACEVKFDTDNSVTLVESAQEDGLNLVEEEAFNVVDRMPELIGGLKTIQESIKYPTVAKNAGIEGRVLIQFTVDQSGHIENPIVINGIGGGCDEEAIRALSQARFEPGYQDGKPVKVKLTLPFRFALSKEQSSTASIDKKIEEFNKQLLEIEASVSSETSDELDTHTAKKKNRNSS